MPHIFRSMQLKTRCCRQSTAPLTSEDDPVVVREEDGRQVLDAVAGLPAQHRRARRHRRRVPRVGTCRRSDTHTQAAVIHIRRRRSRSSRTRYTPTTRECIWEAVPFQLVLRDAAQPHDVAAEQVRVRTRLVRGRGGEVVADEKRVVGRRRQEQGRRQWAPRQPPCAGGGRRRHAGVPNANGALQNHISAFHSIRPAPYDYILIRSSSVGVL